MDNPNGSPLFFYGVQITRAILWFLTRFLPLIRCCVTYLFMTAKAIKTLATDTDNMNFLHQQLCGIHCLLYNDKHTFCTSRLHQKKPVICNPTSTVIVQTNDIYSWMAVLRMVAASCMNAKKDFGWLEVFQPWLSTMTFVSGTYCWWKIPQKWMPFKDRSGVNLVLNPIENIP